MTDDARTTQVVKTSDERPFALPDGLRGELDTLFAPMEHSVAAFVVSAIGARGRHVRSLQAFWLGFSPMVAVALAAVLYVGGMGLAPSLQRFAPQGMVATSSPEIGVNDAATKGLTTPGDDRSMLATGSATQAVAVEVQIDSVRRGVLVSWLRTDHPDVAGQLETGQPGTVVSFTLDVGETGRFISLMILHGFAGRQASGLALSIQSSSEAWMSALRAASYAVALSL